MSETLCVFCQHWKFDSGEPDWSDITPGDPTTVSCMRGHYDGVVSIYKVPDEEAFRALILKAENCPDYLPVTGK